MEIININWYGPYKIDNIKNYDIAQDNGIYAIYRVWNNKEKLIYLGKTERSFIERINEHCKSWLGEKKGQIKIRFGVLSLEAGRKYSSYKLSDVEALLIITNTPHHNIKSIYNYYGREKLVIRNIGRRGAIKEEISTDELEWSQM